MNRQEVKEELINLSKKHKNMLIQLPTGYGKTNIGLSIMANHVKGNILIVIPRNVLIQSWKEEIKKWNMEEYNYTFTTYVSLPKHAGKWDVIIFDECHHLSERCREALASFSINRSILLSATVKYTLEDELKEVFDNLYSYKVKMRDAIENEVLPDPKIYLIPLLLSSDISSCSEIIVKNPKSKREPILCSWATRWQYIKQKEYPVHIYCTQKQYHEDLCSQIEWFKGKYMRTRSEVFKNKWLHLAGDRLKWLAKIKNRIIRDMLSLLQEERCLTFCADIDQTEELGDNCINSKNKEAVKVLEAFNSGKINHITACNMVNEGCNLTNCRVGIYANLNSSETIVLQRMGRLLRHKNPIIIIPYFVGTREEELVNKMMENYNQELIFKISNIKEVKL